jgi:hypothetical protein
LKLVTANKTGTNVLATRRKDWRMNKVVRN